MNSQANKKHSKSTLVQQALELLKTKPVDPKEALKLAKELKSKEQAFGYARKLLEHALANPYPEPDAKLRLELAQKLALCTYKDPDLSPDTRFDKAFEILNSYDSLDKTNDQETLGLAGAIYKRKWEYGNQKEHLERSLAYYWRGYLLVREKGWAEDQGYNAINAAFVLDLLAHQEAGEAIKAGIAVTTPKQFSAFILNRLEIPIIHIPSGNPFTDRTWPELSWREMFRHMYKQERFWSDFAQKQNEVVRSACILHFLNAATSLYPKEYGDQVAKKKEKERLEAQKEVFVRVLQDICVEVVGQPEMTVAVTPDSISETRQRLTARLAEIDVEKAAALKNYDKKAATDSSGFDEAKIELETLHQEQGKVEGERNEIIRRHSELTEYLKSLEVEQARFERVKAGALAFADLKVTHCPACDQEIRNQPENPDCCPVCGRIHKSFNDDMPAGWRRIEFEEQQVSEELVELQRLIKELAQELSAFDVQIFEIEQKIKSKQRSINSARALDIRAIPPELALLDQEAGQIMAQLHQIQRVERSLGTREELNSKILILEEEIALLDAEIKRLTPTVDFEGLGDLISDRMNTYLNLVNTDSLCRWKTGRVSIKLQRDKFEVFLDNQPWTTRAGGTAFNIIQIAYHYALLSLSKDNSFNYPGFLLIDFPPHFSKADDLRDSENYLLKPFVDLCSNLMMVGSQVIIAGRAFDNLDGSNIIKL